MRASTALAALASICALSGSATPSAAEPPAPVALPVDAASEVGGVDVACTGVGADARSDARWATYTVRVEFSNGLNEYLTGGAVKLSTAGGQEMLSVTCDAPWVLMRLPEGRYHVEANIPGTTAAPRSATFSAPDVGQLRVVLQFRDL